MTFAVGQRWISNSESELGLGTLMSLDVRTVTLYFAASEENRVYARQEAPITRVTFNPGDKIESQEGWFLVVEQVQHDNGLCTYIGRRDDTGEDNIALREIMLSHQIRFNKPQDKLFAGRTDRMDQYVLRYRALKNQYDYQKSRFRGLYGMRADLIPHQLYIANEVGRRFAPRVLLADEVGLGKTIEAGMIVHQQIQTGRAERVLIVVPESLIHQWLVEMMRRFNLHFSIFDESRCTEADLDALNPFDTEQYVLCSLEFIRKSRTRFEQLQECEWDLLLVDEAHHLVWDKIKPSREYQIIEALAEQIPSVLLLTATPEQLGKHSHFARLRLLDPDKFYDFDAFEQEEASYQPIADMITLLIEQKAITPSLKNQISELLHDNDIDELLARLETATETQYEPISLELIDQLMDRHGTGRILFRNTRASVKGFPERQLHIVPLDIPNQYATSMRVAGMLGGKLTPEQRALKNLHPEEIFQEFEGDESSWRQFDSRVNWLIGKIKADRSEKILVIAAGKATALELAQALREREGINASVFHEDMSIVERDKAAAYFAQEEDGAQVLICSEIGSEGRNFQFSNQLVMFDLPCNPSLLEQRIGRLDRIGQKRDIQIYVPYLKDTAQEILVRWYDEGLNAFRKTCPAGKTIYDDFSEEINQLLSSLNFDGLENLVAKTADMRDKLNLSLEQGRDKLLEFHSNGGEKAQQLVKDLAQTDNDTNFIAFALNLFDVIGLNQDDIGENAIVVRPSEHMLLPNYPGLPYDGATITFNRDTALSREDIHFMTWEHPMIQGGIEALNSESIGTSAVSLLKNKALPVGTLLLELIYVVDPQAPKTSGISRFLPKTPIRLLLDKQGNDLAAQVDFENFNRQLSPVNAQMAGKLIQSLQPEIHQLIEKGNEQVPTQVKSICDSSLTEMQSALSHELQRLTALQKVNPSIRNEEIQNLRTQVDQLTQYILAAQYQLDAIRVIVVSHN